jgi:hypothetical protein
MKSGQHAWAERSLVLTAEIKNTTQLIKREMFFIMGEGVKFAAKLHWQIPLLYHY